MDAKTKNVNKQRNVLLMQNVNKTNSLQLSGCNRSLVVLNVHKIGKDMNSFFSLLVIVLCVSYFFMNPWIRVCMTDKS